MTTDSPGAERSTVPTGSGEVKWTPGPWSADGPDGQDIHGARVNGNAEYLALVFGNAYDDNKLVMTDETRANARLIAAAPELYEALRDFFENPDFICTVGGNPIRVQAMLARATLALRKARGEA